MNGHNYVRGSTVHCTSAPAYALVKNSHRICYNANLREINTVTYITEYLLVAIAQFMCGHKHIKVIPKNKLDE